MPIGFGLSILVKRACSPSEDARARFHVWTGEGAGTNADMIVLGVVLLLIGLLAGIPILTTIGTILAVVGLVLAVLGGIGRPVGRAHYW